MEVFEAIKKRRSIRRFDRKKKVTDQQIEKLLEAARWAPSAGNLQSRFFIVVKGQKIRRKLALASFGQIWLAQAPVVIVACTDLKKAGIYGKKGKELFAIQDVSIACQNIWLQATEMGLGTVWIGAFSEKLVSKILKLEPFLRPIALMPIGYPFKIPKPTPRKLINEISKIIN